MKKIIVIILVSLLICILIVAVMFTSYFKVDTTPVDCSKMDILYPFFLEDYSVADLNESVVYAIDKKTGKVVDSTTIVGYISI